MSAKFIKVTCYQRDFLLNVDTIRSMREYGEEGNCTMIEFDNDEQIKVGTTLEEIYRQLTR